MNKQLDQSDILKWFTSHRLLIFVNVMDNHIRKLSQWMIGSRLVTLNSNLTD